MRRPAKHRARHAPLGRDFTLLCTGQAVSQLGSRGYGLAIALWTLAATGSAATVGLVSSVTLGVIMLARLPAGWIVDKFDRRWVMMVCDATSALAVGSLALTTFWLPHVLLVVSALAVGWAVRNTAESAAIPNVVEDRDLPRAIALIHGRGYATGIVGPLLSGALFAAGPTLPFLADACSYLVAGGCAALVRRPLRAAAVRTSRDFHAADGFRAVWHHPYLRVSALVATTTGFVIGCSGFLLVVILEQEGAQPSTIGFAFTATYVGGLAGTALSQVGRRRHPPHRRIVTGLAVGTLAALALVPATSVAVCLASALLLLAHPLWTIPLATDWARIVPDEVRGRADAAAGLVVALPAAVAPAAIGVLVAVVTPAVVGLLLTALMSGAALLAARSLNPTVAMPKPLTP